MISILIATRDRSALLAETLGAIAAQASPGCALETIVVDNGSVDDTAAVVAAAAQSSPERVRYLHEARPGKSHALNTAIQHARGDLIVLTDDDVLPSPGWLAAYARTFEDAHVDFAVGRIFPLWEAPPPRWLSPALYGVLAVPDAGAERLPLARHVNEHIMPIGANMAVRRRVIDKIGGWNPDLGKLEGTLRTGEDHEFAMQMLEAGFRGTFEPDAWVRHRVPPDRLRLAYFHRWFHDNGAVGAQLEDRYPTTARYILGVPRHLWRQFGEDVVRVIGRAATLDSRRAAAAWMRAAWFAGYVRARWRRRRAHQSPSRPAAMQRS